MIIFYVEPKRLDSQNGRAAVAAVTFPKLPLPRTYRKEKSSGLGMWTLSELVRAGKRCATSIFCDYNREKERVSIAARASF